MMLIKQEQKEREGEFYMEEEGIKLAIMTYSIADDGLMIINHTEVDDSLRGKKVGYNLVSNAVELAREKNFKILPLCSFAKSVFDKKGDEWKDVLR
ncbi:MAG: GNAT family N-acetyltransferase [Ferruginibacter sp.]